MEHEHIKPIREEVSAGPHRKEMEELTVKMTNLKVGGRDRNKNFRVEVQYQRKRWARKPEPQESD